MEHALIELDQPENWSSALAGLRHPHAHTHAHVAAFAASSPDRTFLYVGRDASGDTLVACPLSVRGEPGEQDVYSPYGFGGFASADDRPAFAAEWDAFASEQGWVATYVLQHPCLDRDLGFPASSGSVVCFVMDLDVGEEELLRRMSQSRRRELRSWARRTVELTSEPSVVLPFYLEVADAFFDDRGAASIYRFAAETWSTLLHAPSVRCLAVLDDGEVVAAIVMGQQCGIVDYLFSVSRPGAGAHSGPLIWEEMRAARESGASELNLGGGIRPDDSVAEFKRRFGPDVRPAPSIRMVHRPDAYRDLCRQAGVPESLDGFFPPYRRR